MKIIIGITALLFLWVGAFTPPVHTTPAPQSRKQQVHVIRTLIAKASVEKPLLEQMVRDEPELLPKSRIGVMLRAANDARLDIPGWGTEILSTLPSSDLEMEAFWEFTHGHNNQVFTPLFRIYYAKAFIAAGRHPAALHKIFSIAREYETSEWPDYDDIDWFCNQLKNTKAMNPTAFDAAVLTETHDMRTYVSDCVKCPAE